MTGANVPRRTFRGMSPQRLEKFDQGGSFFWCYLREQANDFKKRSSWIPLTLIAIVLRDQLLQCGGHGCESVGRGFVSD